MFFSAASVIMLIPAVSAAKGDYPIQPVPFTHVDVRGEFWGSRIRTNRDVTVWYDFQKCEETGRIDNFAKAGGLMPGGFRGIRFNDSDVFKVIEGAAYSLATRPDPKLDKYLDQLIAKIAAAQEDDGYLYTCRTIDPQNLPGATGPTRWSFLAHSHELYNVGHMYEAAVAHNRATGKRTLLDVAIKNAELIDRVFGPNPEQRRDVPGHQEIEIGLAKLYRVTGDERFLKLAKFFLDQRGRAGQRSLYGPYCQDHLPVVEQHEAVGHAVRAQYMYTAMADIAALTGDADYTAAVNRLWQNVVSEKMYLTGGVGSSRHGEAFGPSYELPNATAYNETCAAIANALFNHRMFLLHGDGKYMDVLERVIHNGFLAGVALSGDRFFYPNPLACNGLSKFNQGVLGRSPWFDCSCCPVNVVRFVPSIAGFVYAVREDNIYVNLFVGGDGQVQLAATGQRVKLAQQTRYPWDGRVTIRVEPQQPAEFTVRVRIPGWARNQPVPSDLYRYAQPSEEDYRLSVNAQPVSATLEMGYAVLRRRWQTGDVIELHLPMPVRRVLAHAEVRANADRVALERGPLVYCLEAADHGGSVQDVFLTDDARLVAEQRPDLLHGVTVIRAKAGRVLRGAEGSLATAGVELAAIPYYAWAHRRLGEMAVWLPRKQELARPRPAPTIASNSRITASHVWQSDTTAALNDQIEPASSIDHSIPRHTWWDHRGTREWVQYDFARPTVVSGVEVYWFDDTGRGQCRVPQSWRVMYRDGQTWTPVENANDYGVDKDRFNVVPFSAVQTTGLRLDVQLQPNFSSGILEWRVLEPPKE